MNFILELYLAHLLRFFLLPALEMVLETHELYHEKFELKRGEARSAFNKAVNESVKMISNALIETRDTIQPGLAYSAATGRLINSQSADFMHSHNASTIVQKLVNAYIEMILGYFTTILSANPQLVDHIEQVMQLVQKKQQQLGTEPEAWLMPQNVKLLWKQLFHQQDDLTKEEVFVKFWTSIFTSYSIKAQVQAYIQRIALTPHAHLWGFANRAGEDYTNSIIELVKNFEVLYHTQVIEESTKI